MARSFERPDAPKRRIVTRLLWGLAFAGFVGLPLYAALDQMVYADVYGPPRCSATAPTTVGSAFQEVNVTGPSSMCAGAKSLYTAGGGGDMDVVSATDCAPACSGATPHCVRGQCNDNTSYSWNVTGGGASTHEVSGLNNYKCTVKASRNAPSSFSIFASRNEVSAYGEGGTHSSTPLSVSVTGPALTQYTAASWAYPDYSNRVKSPAGALADGEAATFDVFTDDADGPDASADTICCKGIEINMGELDDIFCTIGLDKIGDETEYNAVQAKSWNVKYVAEINWCGRPVREGEEVFVGCAPIGTNLNKMILIASASAAVVAHEFGHTKAGLETSAGGDVDGHNTNPENFMYATDPGVYVNSTQCGKF